MPRLGDIADDSRSRLSLPTMPWLANAVELVAGGVYLLAGEPGVGKTTIAVQMALDLAAQRKHVLYLTNEQSPADLKATAGRILGGMGLATATTAVVGDYVEIEPLARLEDLEVWRDHVFLPDARWSQTQFLVLDSVQGGGLSPGARKGYVVLERFVNAAKAHKIASVLIAHVTKQGAIAGPKDLEHQVDVVLQFKKAFRLRPLFIPKNRFGPARLDPIPLGMNDRGLFMPPQAKPTGASVPALDFGNLEFAQVQARVQLPRWGEKPGIRAPYLPHEKMSMLVGCLANIPDVDASELAYQIQCLVPGGKAYSFALDLSVVMAILSSYLQRDVPTGAGFYGEVDLHGNVRSPEERTEGEIWKSLQKRMRDEAQEPDEDNRTVTKAVEEFRRKMGSLSRLLCPKDAAKGLRAWTSGQPQATEIVPVGDIQEAVKTTWPELI